MSVFLKDKFKFILTFVFLFSFINTSYWMIKNHPHQYVYFNFLAGKDFNKKFEMDYWGLSYKENIEFLLDYHKAGKINLFNLSHNKLYYPLMGFSKKQKSRINVVQSKEDADYFMTNYYYINPKKAVKLDKNIKLHTHCILLSSPPVSPIPNQGGGGIRKKRPKRKNTKRKNTKRKNTRRKSRKNTRGKSRKNTRRKNTRGKSRKNTRRKNISRISKGSRKNRRTKKSK